MHTSSQPTRGRATPLAWLPMASLCAALLCSPLAGLAQAPPAKGAGLVETDASTGRRVALVIGVEQYQPHANLPALEYPNEDAHAVAATLIERGGFAPTDILLMTSDALDPAMRPTRVNILAQLQELKRRSGVDMVLVYYSGHGTALGDGRARRNYLLPEDFNPEVYQQSAIAVEDLVGQIEGTATRNRVLIFDACRTGDSKGGYTEGVGWASAQYATSEGTRLLYSSAFGEPSYEDRDAEHGAFTAALLDALVGSADGYQGAGPLDGVVSVNEVYRYTLDLLSAPSSSHPAQRPHRAGEAYGVDVAIVNVLPDVRFPGCPADSSELSAALDQALQVCDGPDDVQTRLAEEAYAALSCFQERITPRLAASWHQVEAMRQENLLSLRAAAASALASTKIQEEHGLTLNLPPSCGVPSPRLQEILQDPSHNPATVVLRDDPGGARIYADGDRATDPVVELPFVLQTRWGDAFYYPPVVVRVPADLPEDLDAAFPRPPALSASRSRQLFAGSATSLLLSASLLGTGLLVDRQAEAARDAFYDTPSPDPDVRAQQQHDLEAMWRRANLLWGAGEVAGGVGLGMALIGLQIIR